MVGDNEFNNLIRNELKLYSNTDSNKKYDIFEFILMMNCDQEVPKCIFSGNIIHSLFMFIFINTLGGVGFLNRTSFSMFHQTSVERAKFQFN